MTDTAGTNARSWGYWAVVVLAVVLVLFGLPIFGGGAYLIWLGGSWYYLFAGIGLLVTAWFLVKASMAAVWVYLATFAFTLVWAFWEKGFDCWAQVPRLVAPTVILTRKFSSCGPIQKIALASDRAVASDGFSAAVWGEAAPLTMR